jgi:hypothetical protein
VLVVISAPPCSLAYVPSSALAQIIADVTL